MSAAELLGNPDYPAIAYGGYRHASRDRAPTVADIKEDLRLLSALGIRVLRTYNTQQYPHAERLLQAIDALRAEQDGFEMYVMLGAWIDAKGAWTDAVDHEAEDEANNAAEIAAAVRLAKQHPDSVKIIAVGNEAMVHWAESYFVRPGVILKWVNHLQGLKAAGELPADLWITSSDNFASWGGGDESYHNDDLNALIRAVDFVSMHTYPFHDTHYNPGFWLAPDGEADLGNVAKADAAMLRARDYAIAQYDSVVAYVGSLGVNKPIHIGETGWASHSNGLYGANGSQAADEYKGKRYYDLMRAWSEGAGVTCFYFEAFDEPWKDAANPGGSENHFGLFTVKGEAKHVLWDAVDAGTFRGLERGGVPIAKTHGGDLERLLDRVLDVPDKPQP